MIHVGDVLCWLYSVYCLRGLLGCDVYLLSLGDLEDYLPGFELDVEGPGGVAELGDHLDLGAVYGDRVHLVVPCLCIQLMNSSLSSCIYRLSI